ncbi:MAG TPA: N-acetylmuramoyl-L-alanine amidase [Alphaproteobacteria bacterium]|nr:N-acetylmuramoyl-L-alanine amidase [Alphaproteobacteria bacterium]
MAHPDPQKPLLLTRRRLLMLGAGLVAARFSLRLPAAWAATARAAPLMPPHKPRPPRLLMIDPGHGGHDPGAIGGEGTLEKDVTLDVTARLAEALEGREGVIARRTRETDEFLPLTQRVEIAREARADFLVSIHADSAPVEAARGLSAYSLSAKGSDEFARNLATRENSVDEVGGVNLKGTEPDVAAILMDLTARHTRTAALKAQRSIVRGVGHDWRLLENPMRSANFAVLRAPDIPSLLIETGFLSNPADEKLLSNPAQRQKIAQLLARELEKLLSGPAFA